MLRLIIKKILAFLSSWAIKKHNIELIVVTGFHGSEIVREGIYELLSKTYKVRRNTSQIVWDMSLPLAVLGYEDKRRNIFQWILLIFRAIIYLSLGPKNQHILVLNANCTFEATARFWSSFLNPDYLVVLNYEKKTKILENLLKKTAKKNGKVIYNSDELGIDDFDKFDISRKFSYGQENADLTYTKKLIDYKNNEVYFPENVMSFIRDYYVAIVALGVNHSYNFDQINDQMLQFDIATFLSKRIKENIEK